MVSYGLLGAQCSLLTTVKPLSTTDCPFTYTTTFAIMYITITLHAGGEARGFAKEPTFPRRHPFFRASHHMPPPTCMYIQLSIHRSSSSAMEKHQADAAADSQIQPPVPLPNIRSRREKIYKGTLNYCSTRLACAETTPRLHMPAHPQPQTADVSPARDHEPH